MTRGDRGESLELVPFLVPVLQHELMGSISKGLRLHRHFLRLVSNAGQLLSSLYSCLLNVYTNTAFYKPSLIKVFKR